MNDLILAKGKCSKGKLKIILNEKARKDLISQHFSESMAQNQTERRKMIMRTTPTPTSLGLRLS